MLKFNKREIYILILLVGVIMFYYFSGMGCPILFFTGISCLGCGMTRACISMLQLDFISAFRYHPLCFLLPLAVIIMILQEKMPKKIYQCFLIGMVIMFVIVYMIRLISPEDTIVKIDIQNGIIYKFFQKLSHL